MAAVYEEIVLAWEGEEYTVQPDFRMVQRIESGGISIIGVCQRTSRGEPPMSHVAEILAHMLQSGGAKTATPERVYAHLMAKADAKEVGRILMAITAAFVPVERPSGNSAAPAAGGDQKKRKKKSPT